MKQYQVFEIAAGNDGALEALNRFLREHLVHRVEMHFENGMW